MNGPPPDESVLPIDPEDGDTAKATVEAGHRVVFTRIGRNIGWLLGGRGFAGTVSIGYLAIASRALGPAGFGEFALMLAYGGSIANLAQFKSWQAVIRFGAVHLAERRLDRLARLFGFTATLDLASALIGAAVALLGVHLAGPLLGWNAEQQQRAAIFGAILLLSTGATATGILRLFDRFDLLTYAETVGPAVRLAGAVVVWACHAGVGWFLVVWALAAFAEAAAGWIAVFLMRRTRPTLSRTAFFAAVSENAGIRAFMLQTNVSSSINLLWEQLGTLCVGAFGGAAAGGAFRIASKLAAALVKPIETVTRALYPELAKLAASGNRALLQTVAIRVSVIAAGLAMLLVGIAWLGGPLLLRLFAGRAFAFAQIYLLPLTIAAAIDLSGIVLEPIHNAYGHAGRVLAARSVGALGYLLALGLLLPTIGTTGAAIAAIISMLIIRVLLALSARRLLRPAPTGCA